MTKWEEKNLENPDWKVFGGKNTIAEDKLRVNDYIVCHKNVFFKGKCGQN